MRINISVQVSFYFRFAQKKPCRKCDTNYWPFLALENIKVLLDLA